MQRVSGHRCVIMAFGFLTVWMEGSTEAIAQQPSAPMQIAQEESLRTEEVVISATKTPQPLQEVTSSVQVITGDELEQRKIRTVVDALRQFGHGMAVFSNGGPGTLSQVRIRGAQPRHTLVVIDGTIVNSPTDGAFNFANLTAENIERIEILRGAQSMLWGSDAIGGVINIITKKGRGKPSVGGVVEYGSFATIRESVQASGAKGPFDFSASLLRWDTSSFSAVNYRRGAIERDGFHHWQASSQLGVALPKDGRLEFNLRWWNSDVNLDSAFGNTLLDVLGSRQTTRNLLLSSIYTQPITSWWSQKFLVAQTNEHVLFDSGTFQRNLVTGVVSPVFPFPGDIEILNRRLEWQHNFVVAKPLLLTAGYQFREDQGDAGGSFGIEQPNRLLSSHAGFAQAQFNYQERLLLTAGVRHDDYNVFGVATTYRLTGGYVLKETGTKIRTSYGTGFRAPTLNDLFFQGANNPNLKPEESKSLDVGVDQHFLKERLLLSGTYFWNRFENLIQFVSAPGCPPSAFGTCPQNTQQAKSQGWEARAEYTILENLYIWGQYTYTLTRDLTTGNRLARWPVHQANAGVSYRPIDRVAIHVDYRYVGSRFNDPANTQRLDRFGVVNAAATYDVTKQVQLYGRVENLFNEKYEEILFFGTPIRSVFGGVRITL